MIHLNNMSSGVMGTCYKARSTLLEMFKDRGYTYNGSTDLSPLHLTVSQFTELYQKGDINIKGLLTPDNKPVYVKFLPKDEITTRSGASILKAQFKDIAQHFGVTLSEDISEWTWGTQYKIIMVYDLDSKDIYQETLFEKNYQHLMEVYPIKRLTFNLTKHSSQPKFTLIPQGSSEYQEIIKMTGLELDKTKTLREQGIKAGTKLILTEK